MTNMMTTTKVYAIGLLALLLGLASCSWKREDIGPYQSDQRTYGLTNFDRIDMGSAFEVTLQQGNTFSVTAEGDRRNLDDLMVYVSNGTLEARYRVNRNRQYNTTFIITMPTLRGVELSGASRANVAGFSELNNLDIKLSGASEGVFTMTADRVDVDLSGGSSLRLSGTGVKLSAELSGASILQAFGYLVQNADVDVSGASNANVTVSTSLDVEASGASSVRYRGSPNIRQQVSGASSVRPD